MWFSVPGFPPLDIQEFLSYGHLQIAGLVQDNLVFIIEGALPAALLAILADQFLANIENSLPAPVTSSI